MLDEVVGFSETTGLSGVDWSHREMQLLLEMERVERAEEKYSGFSPLPTFQSPASSE